MGTLLKAWGGISGGGIGVCVVGGGGCLVWFMKVAGNLADWRYCLELQQPSRCNRCIAVERECVGHMSCVCVGVPSARKHTAESASGSNHSG